MARSECWRRHGADWMPHKEGFFFTVDKSEGSAGSLGAGFVPETWWFATTGGWLGILQSRTPFLEALIQTILDYWTEQGVWLTPRQTAIIRFVESRLESLHGRDKIRNALQELVETGVLTTHNKGRFEVTYALNPRYAGPNDVGYLDPWKHALVDPGTSVDEEGNWWVVGKPAWRGGLRRYRLPAFPTEFTGFLSTRARYLCESANLDPDHPEVVVLVRRAIGESALETLRRLYAATPANSPARADLELEARFAPVIHSNPDLMAWRWQQRGKKRRKWRPEDDPWPYLHEIADALGRLCGAWEPNQHGPYWPREVCRQLDRQLTQRLGELLQDGRAKHGEGNESGLARRPALPVPRMTVTGIPKPGNHEAVQTQLSAAPRKAGTKVQAALRLGIMNSAFRDWRRRRGASGVRKFRIDVNHRRLIHQTSGTDAAAAKRLGISINSWREWRRKQGWKARGEKRRVSRQ